MGAFLKGEPKKNIPPKVHDLLLVEIFAAYREIGELLKISRQPEMTQTLLDMKRGLDLAVTHLSPLPAQPQQHWDQLRMQA